MKMKEKVEIAKSRIQEEINKLNPGNNDEYVSSPLAIKSGLMLALSIINDECYSKPRKYSISL